MVRSGSGGRPPEISESDDYGDPTATVDGLFVDAATEAVDEAEDSAAAPANCSPSSEPLPERERPFGRYTLLRRLAYGGMGEVFLARQGGAGSLANVAKLVVIKRILGHMRRDDKHRRMFLDEARLQALLNNPHVVQVYDMGEEDGHVYLAMEHVLGPSWRLIIDRMRRARSYIPIAHVCSMVAQAARGLSYAHNLIDVSGAPLRIVHRDINPHNMLVTYDGEVKIIDFGIAKSELQEGNTETGTIKGKFNYMSPEQSAAKKLDHRSDLFALGICLQELTTNENPFRRPNVVLSLEAIQKEPPVRLARRRPEAGLLQPIVDRCLAKNVDERYADAIFLSDELDELVSSGAVPAPQEPLSSWLRALFSDDIAEHMHILESTGSSNAMVRRDDAGSQRLRAAPRTAAPVRPQASVHNLAEVPTKVSDSPLLDDPSFEVDSATSDVDQDPSFQDLPDDQDGTAATPTGMALASMASAPPAASFDPFADVSSATLLGPRTSVEDAPDLGELPAPSLRSDGVFEDMPVRSGPSRNALMAASAIVVVALIAAAALLGLGVFEPKPDGAPLAAVLPADAPVPPAAIAPPSQPGDAPESPPDGVAPGADDAAAAAAAKPIGTEDGAAADPPANADAPDKPGNPINSERAPRKKRTEERQVAAAAPVLGTVSIGADGYTVKGRRKVTKGEMSTLAVSGGPFEVRLSVKASGEDGGLLTIESEPWALVQVDSMGKGKTPLSGIALPPGKRVQLTLKAPKVAQPMSLSVTWTPAGG